MLQMAAHKTRFAFTLYTARQNPRQAPVFERRSCPDTRGSRPIRPCRLPFHAARQKIGVNIAAADDGNRHLALQVHLS